MSIVNEIKCARCDRKYSGVRSRCPYCGARRIGRGKYSEDSDNARGKMLISVLIMAVFTVAAGVLLFTTPVEAEAQDPGPDPGISSGDPEGDINQLPGLLPPPPPEPEPEQEPEPVIRLEISSIFATYPPGVRPLPESFTLSRAEVLEIGLTIMPDFFDKGDDFNIEWESSDPEMFDVVEVVTGVEGRYGAKVSWISAAGNRALRLTVTVTNFGEEFSWSCQVYTRG